MTNIAASRGILLPFVPRVPHQRLRTNIGAPTEDVNLLHPAFEVYPTSTAKLWIARIAWRRRLAREFAEAPDGMLADFGLTRAKLDAYVARPFWRA